jgi:hypothetical protein
MPEQAHDPELTAFEQNLAALVPASGQLNRDRVMFRAGKASVKRASWLWPAAAGAMTLVAAGLGGLLALRPQPQPQKQIVYVIKEVPRQAPVRSKKQESRPPRVPSTRPTMDEPSYPQTQYFRMENHLLRWGLDGLPTPPPVPQGEAPLTRGQLLDRPTEDAPARVSSVLTFFANLGGAS